MRAWVLHDIGELRLETVDEPVLNKGEVLIEVKAAGICGSDIPRIYQTGTYIHPLIPGHEFSGIVMKAGSGVDLSWIGAHVGIYPLLPCGKCSPCKKRQYELCRHYSYLGSRINGGFAEYVAVPAENLIRLPDHISFEEAAMMEPMSVAAHAMRRVSPQKTDTIVICGLGTIGLLLLMFLLEDVKRKNPDHKRILVMGNKEFQKQAVVEMGLTETHYCDIRKQDTDNWLAEHTGGIGAEVFFECVGKNETVIQAVNYTTPGGKIMMVGNPNSDMNLPKSVYWKILRNQLTILGTWNSSFTHTLKDDWHYVLKRLSEKCIAPQNLISHRYPLETLDHGLQIMRDKKEDYGKIMCEIG